MKESAADRDNEHSSDARTALVRLVRAIASSTARVWVSGQLDEASQDQGKLGRASSGVGETEVDL
jgi:hypothetical protein